MALRLKWHLGQAVPQTRFEPTPVRLRAYAGGGLALDSQRGVLVWEPRRIVPVYAVPEADLRLRVEVTDPQPGPPDLDAYPPMLGPDSFEPHTTAGTIVDLVADGGHRLPRAGFRPGDPDLAGLVVLDFAAFDRWLAEDEELVGHPHDPFKRIDVVRSLRHVEVGLDGTVLAATDAALLLLETHLPTRYYVPPADVRVPLAPSDTRSTCAYTGHASYLSTADGRPEGRDIAWTYRNPLDDALRVRDRVAFWNERTDIRVDGELLPRPVTPWSTPAEQASADAERLEFG